MWMFPECALIRSLPLPVLKHLVRVERFELSETDLKSAASSNWATRARGRFGVQRQAKRDAGLDLVPLYCLKLIQSAVAASLCRRTPNELVPAEGFEPTLSSS